MEGPFIALEFMIEHVTYNEFQGFSPHCTSNAVPVCWRFKDEEGG
jgi:hypothetical protein